MYLNIFIFLTFLNLVKLIKCHQAEPQVELCNVHISEISSTSFNQSQIDSGKFLDNSSTFFSEFNPETQLPQPWLNTSSLSHPAQAFQSRSKRAVSVERHIELLVVIDSSMYAYHGHRLESYLRTQISMVAHIFRHPSVGHSINIKLVGITQLTDDSGMFLHSLRGDIHTYGRA